MFSFFYKGREIQMSLGTAVKVGVFVKNNYKKLLALLIGIFVFFLSIPLFITAVFLPDADEEELNNYSTVGAGIGISWQNVLAMDMVMYGNKLEGVDPHDNAQYFFTLLYEEYEKRRRCVERNDEGKCTDYETYEVITLSVEADNYQEVKDFFSKYGSGNNIVEKINNIKSTDGKRIFITPRDVEAALDDAEFTEQQKTEFYDLLASGVFEEVGYQTGNIGVTPGGDYEFIEIIGSNNWVWPTKSTRITSGFGSRDAPCAGCTTYHYAIDIGATKIGVDGDPVWSMADGVVLDAYFHKDMGNSVFVDHGGGVVSRYIHLSGYTVRPGQSIKRGELLGYMGTTGDSTGTHLDFQIKINGVAVNPLLYFKSL